jgi:hypothetical protein
MTSNSATSTILFFSIKPILFSDVVDEPLRAGDIIHYWSPIFVAGSEEGRRITKIVEIDLSREMVLKLDNGEYLPLTQQVKRIKYLENGNLVDNEEAEYKEVGQYKVENGVDQEYAKTRRTSCAAGVNQSLTNFRNNYKEYARKFDMPVDLVMGKGASNESDNESHSSTSSVSTLSSTAMPKNNNLAMKAVSNRLSAVQESEEDEDYSSVATDAINYHDVTLKGAARRERLECTARTGQKKQAEDVNKCRISQSGELIPKWSVCTLIMPSDKNDFTPKNLPVLVCGSYFYKKSNLVRYR